MLASVIFLILGVTFGGVLMLMLTDYNEKVGKIGCVILTCEAAALALALTVVGVLGLVNAITIK